MEKTVERKLKEKKYATYDIESTSWDDGDVKFIIGCVYDGEHTLYANSARELIDIFLALQDPQRVFYAHFGGKFDIKFILMQLLDDFDLKIKEINSSFVRVKVYDKQSKKKLFELRDSYNILPESLKSLTKAFQVTQKLDVDRANIKKLSRAELEEYVAVDCVALFEVLQKYKTLSGCHDFSLTTASESKKEWLKTTDIYNWQVPAALDEYLRESYYGGRVEVFSRELQSHGFYYDVVSMYPYVMKNRLYPKGSCTRTKRYEKGCLGIYHVRVTIPHMHIPPIPKREKTMLLFPTGTFDGYYTSAELDYVVELGGSFVVYSGYYWEEKGEPFKEYIDKWFAVKNTAKKEGNQALEKIAKLRLNTLYGKCGQRRVFRQLVHNPTVQQVQDESLTPVFEEMNLWQKDVKDYSPFTSVHIASFVTSYARVHLHRGMMEQPHAKIYYCDTDSIITDTPIKTSSELGGFELQYETDEGYFLYPKCYALRDCIVKGRRQDVIRAKGFLRENVTFDLLKSHIHKKTPLISKRRGIIGFFASVKQQKHILASIDMTRISKGEFTKRQLIGNLETSPFHITG